jgi:malate dehydrogenase (oxaloacetate-decarboxylating)(NADP+)
MVAGDANILIFPDLQSGNIAYKMMSKLGMADAIGPILVGMNRPVHVLERGAEVQEIVNMAAVAVVDAQARSFSADGQGPAAEATPTVFSRL